MTAHPQYLTTDRLRRLGVSPVQVNLFRATFGETAEVTPETLTRALDVGLPLAWLAGKVLTAPAWAEYERVKDEAAARLLADPAKWTPGILTAGAQ